MKRGLEDRAIVSTSAGLEFHTPALRGLLLSVSSFNNGNKKIIISGLYAQNCGRLHMRIPTAHDFRLICVRNVRDFPQAKLDSEINARFLLNMHHKVPFLLH